MKTDYKLLIGYLRENIRFFVLCTLIAAFIGFIYLLLEEPKYDVNIIITENLEEERVGLDSGGLLGNLMGGGLEKNFFDEFQETIFSLDVINRLDEKEDLLFIIFKDHYDKENNSYKQIIDTSSRLKKIKFWFYGIDYKSVPNTFMLRDHLKGLISLDYNEFSGLITISSLTSQPYIVQKIIKDLLKETDNSLKELDRAETNTKIEYLYSEIAESKEVNQIAAISNILQNELLKKSLIDSRADYKFKTIRGLEMSEYPIYPDFMFTFLLFVFFGFFVSVAYKLFLFILKDF